MNPAGAYPCVRDTLFEVYTTPDGVIGFQCDTPMNDACKAHIASTQFVVGVNREENKALQMGQLDQITMALGLGPLEAYITQKTTGDEGIKHPGEAWVIKADMIEMEE